MKRISLGYIQFEHGWMGGKMKIGGVNMSKLRHKVLEKLDFEVLVEGDIWLPAEIKVIHGVDHDHGNKYEWSNYDFMITDEGKLGEFQHSARELLGCGLDIELFKVIDYE